MCPHSPVQQQGMLRGIKSRRGPNSRSRTLQGKGILSPGNTWAASKNEPRNSSLPVSPVSSASGDFQENVPASSQSSRSTGIYGLWKTGSLLVLWIAQSPAARGLLQLGAHGSSKDMRSTWVSAHLACSSRRNTPPPQTKLPEGKPPSLTKGWSTERSEDLWGMGCHLNLPYYL